MIILYWPLVIIITLFLYSFILVSIPFSEVFATITLFALISFWSRLPGVGIPLPFHFLYLADLVDFFSLIIAINLGPIQGALFSIFGNLSSRACGITPPWVGVMNDTIAHIICCLCIPFLHAVTGRDLVLSMVIYSLLRMAVLFFINFFEGRWPFPTLVFRIAVFGGITLVINIVYAHYLGPFFDTLLQAGIRFNWILFTFVTIVIVIAKMLLFRSSKSRSDPVIKKWIHNFKKIFQLKKRKRRVSKEVGKSNNRDVHSQDMQQIKRNI